MLISCLLALLIASPAGAKPQLQVVPQVPASVEQLFAARPAAGQRLRCSPEPVKPFLDFSFRFTSGFTLRCPLRQFAGQADTLTSLVRIVPADGPTVVLQTRYQVPPLPPQMAGTVKATKLSTALDYSARFSLGEGRYRVSVLVMDRRRHFCSRTWTLKAFLPAAKTKVPLAIKPGIAQALIPDPWRIERFPRRQGLRLTLLLNVEPLTLRSPELQPRDRALLLDSVASLLKQVPWQSVRVIAFNLDQGREIFQEQKLDQSGFSQLARRLQGLDVGTVSYRALRRHMWVHLLVDLVKQSATPGDPADAVIFLGPRTRIAQRVPRQALADCRPYASRLFYFQYFPSSGRRAEFPDAISYLTRSRGGTVFKIRSPVELARAIRKFQEEVRSAAPLTGSESASKRGGASLSATAPGPPRTPSGS